MRRRAVVGLASGIVGALLLGVGAPVGAAATSLKSWAQENGPAITKFVEAVTELQTTATPACTSLAQVVPKIGKIAAPPDYSSYWKAIQKGAKALERACASGGTPTTAWGKTLGKFAQSLSTRGVPLGHRLVSMVEQASATTTTSTTTTTTTPPCSGGPAIPYQQLVKDPTALAGTCVTYKAKVFQFDTATGLTDMLVDLTEGPYAIWTGRADVHLSTQKLGNGVYETDVIELTATVKGAYSYQTTAGGTDTVPQLTAVGIQDEGKTPTP
jgi:hypothetical protein